MLIRSTLLLSTLLAILLASTAAQAAPLPLSACPAPAHSPESARYDMRGTTQLALTVNAEGKASAVSIAHSSGWSLLDAQALKLAAQCKFAPNAGASTLDVVWPAVTPAPAHPALVAGSCRASPLFRPVAANAVDAALKVRLMVWTDGKIYAPKIEAGTGDARIDDWLLDLMHSCRYTPALREGKAVTGTALMHMSYDRRQLEEPALRALYQRLLPRFEKSVAGENEFQISFKLEDTEAAARAEHARILAGGPFEKTAKKNADDDKWMQPRRSGNAVADAIRAANKPGLLDVVKSNRYWAVVRIDAVRPARPASYDTMLPYLKAMVITGVEPGKTDTPATDVPDGTDVGA